MGDDDQNHIILFLTDSEFSGTPTPLFKSLNHAMAALPGIDGDRIKRLLSSPKSKNYAKPSGKEERQFISAITQRLRDLSLRTMSDKAINAFHAAVEKNEEDHQEFMKLQQTAATEGPGPTRNKPIASQTTAGENVTKRSRRGMSGRARSISLEEAGRPLTSAIPPRFKGLDHIKVFEQPFEKTGEAGQRHDSHDSMMMHNLRLAAQTVMSDAEKTKGVRDSIFRRLLPAEKSALQNELDKLAGVAVTTKKTGELTVQRRLHIEKLAQQIHAGKLAEALASKFLATFRLVKQGKKTRYEKNDEERAALLGTLKEAAAEVLKKAGKKAKFGDADIDNLNDAELREQTIRRFQSATQFSTNGKAKTEDPKRIDPKKIRLRREQFPQFTKTQVMEMANNSAVRLAIGVLAL